MPTSSVVIHVPHSSTEIPEHLRSQFLLSDEALDRERTAMTDHHTLDLFGREFRHCRVVPFPVSRLVVDPERFLDDEKESMARIGMGVVYTRTSDGRVLRHPPTAEQRDQLIADYYMPHHQRLTEAVDAALAARGRCLIIDGHSFPSRPLPYETDQDPGRPHICLGTDRFHTPDALRQLAEAIFQRDGFTVAIDRPFSGTMVPDKHFGKTANVCSLMIEINRGLYVDEETGERSASYENFHQRFSSCLGLLIEAWEKNSQ